MVFSSSFNKKNTLFSHSVLKVHHARISDNLPTSFTTIRYQFNLNVRITFQITSCNQISVPNKQTLAIIHEGVLLQLRTNSQPSRRTRGGNWTTFILRHRFVARQTLATWNKIQVLTSPWCVWVSAGYRPVTQLVPDAVAFRSVKLQSRTEFSSCRFGVHTLRRICTGNLMPAVRLSAKHWKSWFVAIIIAVL